MVFKKRSSNGMFLLPLVSEQEEKKKAQSATMTQTVPLHQIDEEDTAFWRRWSSGQLSQARVEDSKKHDTPTLPQWGNPQDDYYVAAPQQKSQIVVTTRRKQPNVWSFLTLCLLVIGGMTFWHLKGTLRFIREQSETILAVRNQLNIKLRSGEKDVRMLSREVAATSTLFEKQLSKMRKNTMKSNDAARKNNTDAKDSLANMKDQVGACTQQKLALKDAVQRQSKNQVEETYGKGKTIHVQIELEFPDGSEGPSSITVEMAPLDLMPNAVYTFLEMINLGLWDGCSFVMKALHVLKAAPLPYDQNADPAKTAKIFVDKNLNGPIFKEYNNAFPHQLYTLGFAGGDSPSFYINTEDNTDLHAGDSAFAKIVGGFDTLKRVEAAPKGNGIWLRDRIGIKSTKIVVL
jgi:cyclophilin family peptidyl-prolyl cis-trans isomerase